MPTMVRHSITFTLAGSCLLVTLVVGLFALCPPAAADGGPGRFGLGLQITFPVVGASALWNITDTTALEGIVGTSGDLRAYGLKLRHGGSHMRQLRPYAWGLVGSSTAFVGWPRDRRSTWAAGAGIELKLLPSLGWNMEAGFGQGVWSSTGLGPTAGTGVHIYF